MNHQTTIHPALMVLLITVWLSAFPMNTLCAGIPAEGEALPEFSLAVPASGPDKDYLGLPGQPDTFTVENIEGTLFFIEIVGVYCPQCHIQFPKVNKLFHMIKKDPELSSKVKIIAIAAGANPTEINFLKKQFKIPYPVLPDPKFDIHKLLGEPRTPFNMLVTADKKIVQTHMGIVSDMDQLLSQIKKHAQ